MECSEALGDEVTGNDLLFLIYIWLRAIWTLCFMCDIALLLLQHPAEDEESQQVSALQRLFYQRENEWKAMHNREEMGGELGDGWTAA